MKVNVQVNGTASKLSIDDIDGRETVETIKTILYDRFKDVSAEDPSNPLARTYLTINHLRLLYKGKQLPRLGTLDEQQFTDGDTILLFVSNKGPEDHQDDTPEQV